MVHCWDEYLAKVHKAVPVDPWASNVQLLDVFIHQRTSSTWLPAWLHPGKAEMARVGSMLTLGMKDSPNQKVVSNGDGSTASSQSINKSGTSTGLQASEKNVNGGSVVPVLQLVNKNFEGLATVSQPLNNNIINGIALVQPMVNMNNASGVPSLSQPTINDNTTQVPPNIDDANIKTSHLAQPVDNNITTTNLQHVHQKADSSGTPLPNHNNVSNSIDRAISAHPQHIRENFDSGELPIDSSLLIKTSSMPDIQTSIKSSTSLLASFTGGSAVSGQFDAKGSKTVTCNVGGVKSQWVDMDTLMELVNPRPSSGLPARWRPDISLPQLQWSSKRGQTLWVVIEIMYANKIKMEMDNQAQADAKAKVSKAEEAKGQMDMERDSVWTVIATKDNPTFPFALRLLKLDYDACGSIVSKESLRRNNSLTRALLRRNNSLNNRIKQLSSKDVDKLYRSSSISCIP